MTEGHDSILRLPDGTKVGLAVYGDPAGLPVLAFHGTPASRLMYRKGDAAARKLGLKLIATDRPGYGLSPIDRNGTLASRTALHVAVADTLGLDRFALVGISGGSPYAAALASRLADRVTALALVSPMGPVADYVAAGLPRLPLLQRRFFLNLSQRGWLVKPGAALGVAAFRAAPRAFAHAFKGALGGDDSRILSDPGVLDGLIEMTREALRSGAAGAVADFRIYGQPWAIDYQAISSPATIWAGTADKVVPVPVCAYLAQRIPRGRLITVPGGAHFWILEHVSEVLARVRTMTDTAQVSPVEPGAASGVIRPAPNSIPDLP
ncbi:MAG: alpha/beta fold hydrolase [Hyphomicrobiaceae bacterium]|nr:alpha/beta fold hydrolase [Hyphomicrobiaceae bacterium]